MFNNSVIKVNVSTREWLRKAGTRAIKTVAQTAIAVIGTGTALGAIDWKLVASSAVVAGIVSVLTSIGGIPEVKAVTEEEDI